MVPFSRSHRAVAAAARRISAVSLAISAAFTSRYLIEPSLRSGPRSTPRRNEVSEQQDLSLSRPLIHALYPSTRTVDRSDLNSSAPELEA